MAGIVELDELLKTMNPVIQHGEYVFCTVAGEKEISDYVTLNPRGCFWEPEGLTLILSVEDADKAQLAYESKFKQITLMIHSSLDAIGLTDAIASKLASVGISANMVAAYYHDHIFVQTEKAQEALVALQQLAAVKKNS